MKQWPFILSLISFIGMTCGPYTITAVAPPLNAPPPSLKAPTLKDLLQTQKQEQTLALRAGKTLYRASLESTAAALASPMASAPLEQRELASLITPKHNNTDTRALIEQAIERELQATYGDMLAIKVPLWSLPQGHYTHYLIDEIQVEADQSRFTALITFSGTSHTKTLPIRGTIEQMVDVPAVLHPIHYGEIIKAQDLTSIKIPGKRVGRHLIRDPKDLIGTTPRRGFLKINTPITAQEITKPQEVNKGDVVTMRYYTDKMKLIAKGRALEGGTQGEMIRILNISSDKIVQGQVVGLKEVSLTPEF